MVENLGRAGMTREAEGAFRSVVVEKPYGADLQSDRQLNARLLEVLEGREDSATAEALTRGLLARHPELVGLYSAGAGNRGIIAALADVPPARRPIVVAHELSPYVRDALLSGVITAVLHQNQAHEAAEALAAMRAAAGFAVPSAGGARPIPTEIFLRDNVP